MAWWEWVDRRMDYRLDAMTEATGQVLCQFRAEARDEVDIAKRELALLRRELTVLREEVGLERGLRDLRDEVEEARAKIPKFERLEAKQARLQCELDATKNKLNRLRTEQSITDYGLSELRKKTEAAARAAVQVDVEFETARFTTTLHPDAAAALRQFAEVVGAQDGWLSAPAGAA
jgi:chromosome segregation ATPase